jgi:hypothetical protein
LIEITPAVPVRAAAVPGRVTAAGTRAALIIGERGYGPISTMRTGTSINRRVLIGLTERQVRSASG